MSLVDEMNQQHFIVRVGGKTRIGTDVAADGTVIPLEYSTFEDFKNWYYGKTISLSSSNPETGEAEFRVVPVAKYWLGHPEARRYRGVVFDPGLGKSGDLYNIWRGFDVDAKEGEWGKFRAHILDNLCCGDEAIFSYVLGWMAFAVQCPDRPAEVALVFRGAKGTGKGTFANAFGKLFKPHYLAISNRGHLTGRFNAHLMQTVVLFVDEGFWAGDREGEGVLKQLITEPFLPIERKFFDVENAPNRLHIIIASNESWVVPARGLERRFCVMNVSDKYAKNTTYFASIWKELQSGGYEGMLFDLLAMDISGFDIRKAPMTAALQEQMLHSLTSFEAWWFNRLQEGCILPGRDGWGEVDADVLYKGYRNEAEGKHVFTKQQFGAEMEKLVPEGGMDTRMVVEKGGKRVKRLGFVSLEKCRAEWERQRGIKIKWFKGEKADG